MTKSRNEQVLPRADAEKRWFQGRAMTVAMLAICLSIAGVAFWQFGISGLGDSLLFLLLLACPALHFFMHRGHGHGGHHEQESRDAADGKA